MFQRTRKPRFVKNAKKPQRTVHTPELFEKAFRHYMKFTAGKDSTARILRIVCWNKWTEGSYLEPCQEYGYARLKAVKRVVYEVCMK